MRREYNRIRSIPGSAFFTLQNPIPDVVQVAVDSLGLSKYGVFGKRTIEAICRESGLKIDRVIVNNYSGIYKVTFKKPTVVLKEEPKNAGSVTISYWEGLFPATTFVSLVEEILLPVVHGKDIEINVPHGRMEPENKDPNKLCISIYSWPETYGLHRQAEHFLFGGKPLDVVAHIPHVLLPRFRNVDDGFSDIGVISLNHIYIYPDIAHNAKTDIQALKQFLNNVAQTYKAISENSNIADESKQAFVKTITSGIRQLSQTSHNRIQELKHAQSEMLKQIGKSGLEIRELQHIIDSLRIREPEEKAFALVSYDKIQKSGTVNEIICHNSLIVVETTPIIITDPRTDKKHLIGSFRITINTADQSILYKNHNGSVRTPAGHDMIAPHVWRDGNVCYGNVAEAVARLIAEQEFAALIILLINYLSTVDVKDSVGCYVNHWPEYKSPEEIVKETTIQAENQEVLNVA